MQKRGTILIHEITNDIGTAPDAAGKCAAQLVELAKEAKTKADKVIISLGVPRQDNIKKHEATKLVNLLVKNRLTPEIGVETITHDNLLWHGKASYRTDTWHITATTLMNWGRTY